MLVRPGALTCDRLRSGVFPRLTVPPTFDPHLLVCPRSRLPRLGYTFLPSFLATVRAAIVALFLLFVAGSFAKAATIFVPAGGDLQAALYAAQFGDTIVAQAGATYSTSLSFTLPNKGAGTSTDADYITVQTSNLASLASSGVRLNPALQAAALVKLISTGGYPGIDASGRVPHW